MNIEMNRMDKKHLYNKYTLCNELDTNIKNYNVITS